MNKTALLLLVSTALCCPELCSQRGRRAPSAADWRRPPRIAWQRDLDDALAVVRETGRPLLICVNMDGEVACDSLASGRYRDPAFAELAAGFVPLIASPDRHTEADHDAAGRRVECPRFGRVTCGEHIRIEPELYAAYFKGERVAPRHLAVDSAGNELFDLYLLNRLDAVDEALRQHGDRAGAAEERPIARLVQSHDAGDRTAVEEAFARGAEDLRLWLVERAGQGGTRHFDVLRLGLRDESPVVVEASVDALASSATNAAVDLFERAFAAAKGDQQRGALRAALARLEGEGAVRRRIDVLRGVFGSSAAVDTSRWLAALGEDPGAAAPPPDAEELDELDQRLDELSARARETGDPRVQVEIAAATMRYALVTIARGGDPRFLLEDVRSAAARGEDSTLAARALGYRARASYLLGEFEIAAELAARALPGLSAEAGTPLAGDVLAVLAECRARALYEAMATGAEWPSSWISDVHAASTVLAAHAAGSDAHAAAHLDLLAYLEAAEVERAALRTALRRFPTSARVHERLRRQLLRDGGPAALERAYAEIHPASEHAPAHAWFSGYAHLVAAERHVEARDTAAARAASGRAIESFGASAEAEQDFADSAAHYAALALAGRARLGMESGAFAGAIDDIVAAIACRTESATLRDGLGVSPLESARLLRRALLESGQGELAGELVQRLRELDVDLAETGGRG